jgi:hypothetical protein
MLVTAAPDRRQRGSQHHVCLRVPDIQVAWETVAARSAAMGRPPAGPPNVGVNGRWQLNLFDVDGTRVELMEPFTIRPPALVATRISRRATARRPAVGASESTTREGGR